MKISELIGSLQQCDPNLDVTVEIKFARELGDAEFRGLSGKERKRVTLQRGKPVALESLALPAPSSPGPLRSTADEPSLNERLARAFG